MASKEAMRAKTVGNVAYLREQHQSAVEAFQDFLSKAPQEGFLALTNIAACRLAMHQYQETVDAGFQALHERRKPALKLSAKLFYRMGRAFQELGQPARARIMYKRALNCCWNDNIFALYSSQLPPTATSMSIPPLIPCRRKVFDRGMQSFSLGNTPAMNVFHRVDLDAVPESHIELTDAMAASDGALSAAVNSLLRVLFIGVGDIRNPLCFLHEAHTAQPVEIHVNDIALPTLARDLVLFKICRSSSTADLVSVWCNALLSPEQHALFRTATSEIITTLQAHLERVDGQDGVEEVQFEDWLVMHSPVWFLLELLEHVKLWEVYALKHEQLGDMRFRMFKTAYALSSGVTLGWLQYGLCYMEHLRQGPENKVLEGDDLEDAVHDWLGNPTLLDVSKLEWLDIQGPYNAFWQLQDYAAEENKDTTQSAESRVSTILHACWDPLLKTFQSRIESGRVHIHIWPGDGTCILEDPRVFPHAMPSDLKFDCIDTSNVADYIGVWTLLLPALERCTEMARRPFVQVQHMMYTQGVAQFLFDQVLVDHDYATLFRVCGLSYRSLNYLLDPEDDNDWPYIRFTREPYKEEDRVEDSVVVDLLTRVFQASITHLPMPNTDDTNTTDPFRVFRRGWNYKPIIATTFARMLRFFHCQLPQYRHLVPQVIDKILSSRELWDACPCGEQRRMQFEVALQAENWRVHALTGETLGFNYKLLQWTAPQSDTVSLSSGLTRFAGVVMLTFKVEPVYDLDGLRGGIFEPALCCICVRGNNVRKAVIAVNGIMERHLPEYARVGEEFCGAELFRLLGRSSARDVQIIDSLQYDAASHCVTLLMPAAQIRGHKGFTHILLSDVQTSEIIAAPVDINSCTVIELA